jgi:hypothetical protein
MKPSWKWKLFFALAALLVISIAGLAGLIAWSGLHPAPVKPVTTAADAITRARQGWRNTYEKANWHKIVSPEETSRFEPYVATYLDGYWIVMGTFPPGYEGEILVTKIRASDGATWLTGFLKKNCLSTWYPPEEALDVCRMIESESAPR